MNIFLGLFIFLFLSFLVTMLFQKHVDYLPLWLTIAGINFAVLVGDVQ